jgi:hypothetical protein
MQQTLASLMAPGGPHEGARCIVRTRDAARTRWRWPSAGLSPGSRRRDGPWFGSIRATSARARSCLQGQGPARLETLGRFEALAAVHREAPSRLVPHLPARLPPAHEGGVALERSAGVDQPALCHRSNRQHGTRNLAVMPASLCSRQDFAIEANDTLYRCVERWRAHMEAPFCVFMSASVQTPPVRVR